MKKKWVGNVPEHTQIIQFVGGVKKTIKCIVRIDEGELLTLTSRSGKEFLIDKSKVLWVERYIENGKTEPEKQVKSKTIKVLQKRTGYDWYGAWIEDGIDYGNTKEVEVDLFINHFQ